MSQYGKQKSKTSTYSSISNYNKEHTRNLLKLKFVHGFTTQLFRFKYTKLKFNML